MQPYLGSFLWLDMLGFQDTLNSISCRPQNSTHLMTDERYFFSVELNDFPLFGVHQFSNDDLKHYNPTNIYLGTILA